MSDNRKCSKPGCGAINAIGQACLDRDCPQMWVHYTAYNAEVERLTRELSEARAAGRAEGMEEAARYHDLQIADLEDKISENTAYCEKHGINISSANNYCRKLQFFNRLSAADIRAAKEKHGKRRNAADG